MEAMSHTGAAQHAALLRRARAAQFDVETGRAFELPEIVLEVSSAVDMELGRATREVVARMHGAVVRPSLFDLRARGGGRVGGELPGRSGSRSTRSLLLAIQTRRCHKR